MTTDDQKKKTCPNSQLSWQFSLFAFLMVLVFVFSYTAYYASLKTNNIAKFVMLAGLVISVVGSFIGFILGFCALFKIVLSKFKQKGIFRALLGLLLPVLTAGFIMPAMGISDQFVYLRNTDKQILQFLNEYDKKIERRVLWRNYGLKMEGHTKEDIPFVKLRFELFRPSDNYSLPETFEAKIYKGLDKVECEVVGSLEE